jgi:site-specific DNA recombinase
MASYGGVTGAPLPHSTVSWILRNRKYLGEYRFNETVNKNAWPAIIDEATFNRAQDKLTANTHHTARFKACDDYILTGKLFCGKCGSFMTAESSNKSHDKIYRYYKCQNVKHKHTCDKAPIRKEVIEELVIAKTQSFLRENSEIDALVEMIYDHQKKVNPDILILENQIWTLDKKAQNLVRP